MSIMLVLNFKELDPGPRAENCIDSKRQWFREKIVTGLGILKNNSVAKCSEKLQFIIYLSKMTFFYLFADNVMWLLWISFDRIKLTQLCLILCRYK